MDAIDQKPDALRLLAGLENGGLSQADAAIVAQDLDPVLIYVIVSFLRAVYPASDPVATAVLDRVVQLTSHGQELIRLHREGGEDSVSQWFESEYSYHDYKGRGADLVALIVDKLDS